MPEVCMRAPDVSDDCVITLSVANVSKTFKQVNIHKATGPDGLPGRVLRAFMDQLASIFINIFNLFNPGTKHLPLQLDPGLPYGPPPGGKGRQQHICQADPQHLLSPLLNALFTHNCVAKHASNTIIKCADYTRW
jgi:hypothetical protein